VTKDIDIYHLLADVTNNVLPSDKKKKLSFFGVVALWIQFFALRIFFQVEQRYWKKLS